MTNIALSGLTCNVSMNFLAHLYLSGADHDLLVGNFIADHVKGKQALSQFSIPVVRGILLHRAIDQFTDSHPLVAQSKNRLRAKYRHYSGVLVDVFYDHFLAKNWSNYHVESLESYASGAYAILSNRSTEFPASVQQFLPYMIRGNWLVAYSRIDGIHRALTGMSRRTPYDSKMDEAITELTKYQPEFEAEFQEYFPQLIAFTETYLNENPVIISQPA